MSVPLGTSVPPWTGDMFSAVYTGPILRPRRYRNLHSFFRCGASSKTYQVSMFCASCHWYLPHTKSKKLHVFRSWFSRIFNSKRQVFPIPPSDTTHFSISYIGIDLIMIQYTSNHLIKFTAFWKNTHPKKHGTNLNPYLVGLQNTSTHWSLHPHWEKAPRQRWWVAWAFFFLRHFQEENTLKIFKS